MAIDPKQRRAARHAPSTDCAAAASHRRPITVERITDAALEIVATQGYDALTMRSVAAALGTGPASLYTHVVNKADLDELVIGRLCHEIDVPEPDPERWREQIVGICTQLRDQYLAYPGISRAALAVVVTDLDVLRINEGMLAVLLAGGVAPQRAAWAIDALYLYVSAYTMEISLVPRDDGERDGARRFTSDERDEVERRLAALPADQFPYTRRHATELTSGDRHERFDFTVGLIVANLA